MPTCNNGFQSRYGKIEGRTGYITIEDYLDGIYGEQTVRCVPNGHELIPVRSKRNRVHFRHKHCADTDGHYMTEWHNEWQSNFPVTEQCFKYQAGQLRDRRADVVLPEYKRIVEIQHSPISSGEVSERNKDYGLHGYEVCWVIHGQDLVSPKRIGDRLVLQFTDTWQYESFLSCKTVYYDIHGLVYKVNPSTVRSRQTDVLPPQPKDTFIEALKTNTDLWGVIEPPQCKLIIKQQGAGNGKTYGIIQSLNNDKEIACYRCILFLTKQHSAVKVMYKEFNDQLKAGLLYNLDDVEQYEGNKKHIVTYTNKLTGIESVAIFGTVDSFTYAIGDKDHKSYDTFVGIIESIRNGRICANSIDGKVAYAGKAVYLNKETILIGDETQDLSELYGEAFLRIVLEKHTNLCVVGDKLQSLSYEDNALTFLQDARDPLMAVITEKASNEVRRFTHPTLIDFVNKVIPFDSFGLPKIQAAVDVPRDNSSDPLVVFQAEAVYNDDGKIVEAVEEIMELFHHEVITNNRVPEDFLFVTPFTGKNSLVDALQIAINMYWKNIMESDKEYINNVKSKHPYWRTINTDEYIRYAIFHKSEEGTSINTDESVNATRMVSIHSSKGDGRNVVFVIGLTQSALQRFSHVVGNLTYESLLHVALTRMKQKLYFRLENNGDDICRRMIDYVTDVSTTYYENLRVPKITVKMQDIVRFSLDNKYSMIYDTILQKADLPPLKSKSEEKQIVDMGDHHIRYASMFMNIKVHCCNYELSSNHTGKKQHYAILRNVCRTPIKIVSSCREYMNILKGEKKEGKKNVVKYIPLLRFPDCRTGVDYEKYFNVIYDSMLRIKEEIANYLGKKEIRSFCPLESVILYYMIETLDNGQYHKITANDLYNIINVYSKAFDVSATGHDHCVCTKAFPVVNRTTRDEKTQRYTSYLQKHYEMLGRTNKVLDIIDAKHPKINWLYNHHITMQGGNEECSNSDFMVHSNHSMVGYDDACVINIQIVPQFNELNYNNIVVTTLFESYILTNVEKSSENYTRFANKPIYNYVIALNQETPYELNWTVLLRENQEFMKQMLYDSIYDKYSVEHIQYHEAFKTCVNALLDKKPSRVIDIILNEKIIVTNGRDKDGCPPYITKALQHIAFLIDTSSSLKQKQKILIDHTECETFITLFDHMLNSSVRKYVGLPDDEDDDTSKDE